MHRLTPAGGFHPLSSALALGQSPTLDVLGAHREKKKNAALRASGARYGIRVAVGDSRQVPGGRCQRPVGEEAKWQRTGTSPCIVSILYKYVSHQLLIRAETVTFPSEFAEQGVCFGNSPCSQDLRGAGGEGNAETRVPAPSIPERMFLSFFPLCWLCHELKCLQCQSPWSRAASWGRTPRSDSMLSLWTLKTRTETSLDGRSFALPCS